MTRLNPKIEIKQSPIEGKGLFAREPFVRGERFTISRAITEGDSVAMCDAEFQAYTRTVSHWDAVYLGNGKHRVSLLDRGDDPANYGNHSCDPNTALDGDVRVALRDIAEGEEITIDYRQLSPISWSILCNCGSANCEGVVHGIKA